MIDLWEIDPDNPCHQARVDAARESCIITEEIVSPAIVGHRWDYKTLREAYSRAAAIWGVDDEGRVKVTYRTHVDKHWLVQSYYRVLWSTLESCGSVDQLPVRDQLDALIGAYLYEIWVRSGGARILTV